MINTDNRFAVVENPNHVFSLFNAEKLLVRCDWKCTTIFKTGNKFGNIP